MEKKMNRYAYWARFEPRKDETFLRFAKFPEIITALPARQFKQLDRPGIEGYALDAVLTALQLRIAGRGQIPRGDHANSGKGGLVVELPIQQAIKLELFRVYRESSCSSVSEFARSLGKSETAVRRLLNLRHQSWPTEIEEALGLLGKRLIHSWGIEDMFAGSSSRGPVRSRAAKAAA